LFRQWSKWATSGSTITSPRISPKLGTTTAVGVNTDDPPNLGEAWSWYIGMHGFYVANATAILTWDFCYIT